jgi:hypothetical protein
VSGMPEISDERPRPTPRPRSGSGNRPTPRPRVAGSRRDRHDEPAAERARTVPSPHPRPARDTGTGGAGTRGTAPKAVARSTRRTARAVAGAEEATGRRPGRGTAIGLAVLCLLSAGGAGFLFWQRLHPQHVNAAVFDAVRSAVQTLYAYDYKDSDGSVQRKLTVLTGDLRDQYRKDLSQGGVIDSAQQVSATTRLDVLDVGMQQINEAQDAATLVVFGDYVVKSVNSADQAAPQGSACQITPDGAQACKQTIQVHVVRIDGEWKIDQVTVLTSG